MAFYKVCSSFSWTMGVTWINLPLPTVPQAIRVLQPARQFYKDCKECTETYPCKTISYLKAQWAMKFRKRTAISWENVMLNVPKLNSKPVYFWCAAWVAYVQGTLKRNCQNKNPMLTGKKQKQKQPPDFSPVSRNSLFYVFKPKDVKNIIYFFIYPNGFIIFFPTPLIIFPAWIELETQLISLSAYMYLIWLSCYSSISSVLVAN